VVGKDGAEVTVGGGGGGGSGTEGRDDVTETIEVIDWEPPKALTIAHGPPLRGRGTWTLERTQAGTRFTWAEEVELETPALGWLISAAYAPVLGWLLRRSMRGLRASIIARGPDR